MPTFTLSSSHEFYQFFHDFAVGSFSLPLFPDLIKTYPLPRLTSRLLMRLKCPKKVCLPSASRLPLSDKNCFVAELGRPQCSLVFLVLRGVAIVTYPNPLPLIGVLW